VTIQSKDYDTDPAVSRLLNVAESFLGPVAWRLVAPEMTDFITQFVAQELRDAFRDAEGHYLAQSLKQAQEQSGLVLKAALAGAHAREYFGFGNTKPQVMVAPSLSSILPACDQPVGGVRCARPLGHPPNIPCGNPDES
jgi:hypothetical protein